MNVYTAAYLRIITGTKFQLQCWKFRTSTAVTRPNPPISTTNNFRLSVASKWAFQHLVSLPIYIWHSLPPDQAVGSRSGRWPTQRQSDADCGFGYGTRDGFFRRCQGLGREATWSMFVETRFPRPSSLYGFKNKIVQWILTARKQRIAMS